MVFIYASQSSILVCVYDRAMGKSTTTTTRSYERKGGQYHTRIQYTTVMIREAHQLQLQSI